MFEFSVIVACESNGGIGKNNAIPWYLPNDLKHFKNMTSRCPAGYTNAVIMGKNTWNSLPRKPLPQRINIVVSSSNLDVSKDTQTVLVAKSLQGALDIAASIPTIYNTFVIGGSKMYEEALRHPKCAHVYITHIFSSIPCDVWFPLEVLDELFVKGEENAIQTEDGICYAFCKYLRR